MMKKRLVLLVICVLFSSETFAQNVETTEGGKDEGTITGTIKARGVRDARDAVIYLDKVKGKFLPLKEKPVLDQRNLIFVPHILPVLSGTTVQFLNSDSVRHNVFSPSKTKQFNLGTYSAGVVREVTFEKTGKVTLLCNVHTEMSAYIVVLENPYFTKTGPDGKYTITNVPEGTYRIKTWHEKLKEKEQGVTVIKGKTTTVNFSLSR